MCEIVLVWGEGRRGTNVMIREAIVLPLHALDLAAHRSTHGINTSAISFHIGNMMTPLLTGHEINRNVCALNLN